MTEQIAPVEYDNSGRMKYNPDLHFSQGKPWTDEDIDYLINWYSKIGLEEMSLALGKTEATVATKVAKLRKRGLMGKEKSERLNRELKTRARQSHKTVERKLTNDDLKTIAELKETKTLKEIAQMYNVSLSLVGKRFLEYKKATKNPDQSVQSSIQKQSQILYHMEGGMQVVS
jgi:polyhydroxyalkanoate synthesis regulator phasin